MSIESILSDARAFMKSRVILTAAELDIFTIIEGTPLKALEVAQRLHLDERALTRILDCLVTLGLIEKDGGAEYRTAPKGIYLSSKHPDTVLPMVLHFNRLWDRWGSLSAVAREGTGRSLGSGLQFTDRDWTAFIGAMHVAARDLSAEIAESYDTQRFKRMLDVGGASGTYTVAFLAKNAGLKAVLFDLPDVIPMAQERMRLEGLSARVECIAGDFYEDDLPPGCDLALLSAIVHQNSIDENLTLFQKVFTALKRGGSILIRDHVMDASRTHPAAGAMFALNMLVNTHGGDTYTFEELKNELEAVGFTGVKLLRTGDRMDCLVEATKP
jgi:hypothetical protein